MAGGRPREYDREKIAKELVEWAKNPDSVNFNKFCCTREPPIPASKLLIWSNDCDEFRYSYETAKAFLACRREEWLSSDKLHVKAYDLNNTVYDLISRDEKLAISKYESDMRKEENGSKETTFNLKVSHALGDGLKISTEAIPSEDNKGSK